ncbi:MAG: LON peptidase substrate-binding domain-containing protein [Verrucomicrobia bacterium]|nr:LON peptidase substrate-binding domain-containing protein [Verrucomicrobiota bacterium]
MVLPGTTLFPHALLPLHIFEPRYRAMLTFALEEDRAFCIAMVRPGKDDWTGPRDFVHTAGLGLIRACVSRPDGTSNLVLQGLARVHLSEFEEQEGFVLAQISSVLTTPATEDGQAAAGQVRLLCQRFKEKGVDLPQNFEEYLNQISEPGVLADVVANTFVAGARERQRLLEQPSEDKRLALLVRYLKRELRNN